jgi:steroid delta-isomerase-like uncharacterized protein
MKQEQKKNTIARIAEEIWNRGRLDVMDDIMHPDAAYHGPHMPDGTGAREDWCRAVGFYRMAFPDSHVVFDDLIDCGEVVVGRWSATGTHSGPMPGLPPTGRKIAISGITIYRFDGNRISEAWEQLDLLGMWKQLGVVKLRGLE